MKKPILKTKKQPTKKYYWDNMPKVQIPTHIATLIYSNHAKEEAEKEEFQQITRLPATLDLATANLIEIEIQGDKIVKLLYNMQYNKKYQISFALMPLQQNEYLVKTVWLNTTGWNKRVLKGLNRDKYDIPEVAFKIHQETKRLISKKPVIKPKRAVKPVNKALARAR